MANGSAYKALVEQINGIQTPDDFIRAWGDIEMAYHNGRTITYADHERLFRLLGRIGANH